MKSFSKRFINKLLKFPISIKLIKFIEEISQNYQGKGNGWGVDSIENEVKNCLSLLKISPKNFIDIGANKGEYTNYLLKVKPNLTLIDGNFAPLGLKNYKTIINGDEKVKVISAASIIAKVYRDRLMVRLSKTFSNYAWERNFGYGTKAHLEGLKKFGVTKHHRKGFKPVYKILSN